jgi:hypothetical protein
MTVQCNMHDLKLPMSLGPVEYLKSEMTNSTLLKVVCLCIRGLGRMQTDRGESGVPFFHHSTDYRWKGQRECDTEMPTKTLSQSQISRERKNRDIWLDWHKMSWPNGMHCLSSLCVFLGVIEGPCEMVRPMYVFEGEAKRVFCVWVCTNLFDRERHDVLVCLRGVFAWCVCVVCLRGVYVN